MPEDVPASRHRWYIYGLVLFVTVIWSLNYIVAKFALREVPAMLASSIRTLVAALLLIPIYVWHVRRNRPEKMGTRRLWKVILLGLFGVGLNQVLFVFGLSRTTASHAAIIIGLTPMVVLILASLSGQERLRLTRFVAMCVALAGVAILQTTGSGGGATLLGDACVFLGSLAFAFFVVQGKRVTQKLDPIVINTAAYLASAAALLPVTLWYVRRFDFAAVSVVAWISIGYMAVFSSVVGYVLYYYALTHAEASRVSAFSYLQPLIVIVLAILLLGEKPAPSLLSGGALVLAGVFWAERS